MQQRHYARHARVGVWGSHALDKKVGVTISSEFFWLKSLQTRTFFGVSITQFIFSSYYCLFLFPRIASECDGEVCSGPKCVLRLWSEWGHLDHVPLVGWCASASASANNSGRNSASSIVPHVFWLLMGSLSAYTAPPSKRIN